MASAAQIAVERTLARAAGLSTAGAFAALGDVRIVAELLPQMLSVYGRVYGEPIRFGCAPRWKT